MDSNGSEKHTVFFFFFNTFFRNIGIYFQVYTNLQLIRTVNILVFTVYAWNEDCSCIHGDIKNAYEMVILKYLANYASEFPNKDDTLLW